MKRKYEIFKTNDTKEVIYSDKPLELDTMQKIVGGNIELVSPHFSRGIISVPHKVFCHEEGKLEQLEPNPWFNIFDSDHLVGDVIVEYLEKKA